MINEITKPQDILKRATMADDSLTGGGAGGFLRDVYRYLFGLKRKIPHARIAAELNDIADIIRNQPLTVSPKTLASPRTLRKLAHIVAWCGEHNPQQDVAICLGALNAIEVAMEWPIRDWMNPGAVIAKLEGTIGIYETMQNAEVVGRIKRTLRAIEQRRVPGKPNTRKL